MKIHNKLFLRMVLGSIFLFPFISYGQTNFFYFKGEKVTLNVKNAQVSIIFSKSTTKSKALELLSKHDFKGEIEPITNVALKAFYQLKYNESKDISKLIRTLQA